jgi:hypothetical protein
MSYYYYAFMATLQKWMSKALTLPELQTAIIGRIQTVRTATDNFPVPTYAWPGINDLIRKQDVIGWKNFMEGGILHEWAAKQQEYYDWLQRRNTGKGGLQH